MAKLSFIRARASLRECVCVCVSLERPEGQGVCVGQVLVLLIKLV